ncbi:differentially expressed in FDCP 6 homolog [Pristis pectinata]|uniref:differentially expressed in FDCP 6 homolog n=1 Tax=Pristis pectinata TaxID=685728 RepID=UPI00223CF554|nr:differentially expressed in FDCP 6 homolog [Pristis pectinata]
MDLKSELLKSIWYAFTALDREKSGKVSKSQLKVLSHNLYTALNIPHDPTALEDHFRDDNDGPVSSHGYMPYLNKYILDKAQDGNFAKETFNELCWTLTARKNYKPSKNQGLISEREAFMLWCLFNFLSEDKYPLVMVQEEVVYLLRKLFTAMGQEWLHEEELSNHFMQNPSLDGAVTVWQFLDLMESGRFTKPASKESLALGICSVYEELVLDVTQKGYMWKKGYVRRNWNERWFVLKACNILYYVNEDLKEKKGEIHLDKDSTVEALLDKDGRRCVFCIKTANRTYELSASDTKRRQEWMESITTAIWLQSANKPPLHKEQRGRRREQRQQVAQRRREEEQWLAELKQEKERHLRELERLKQAQEEAQAIWRNKEFQWTGQQEEMQQTMQRQLQKAQKDNFHLQLEVEQKELEVGAQRRRIQELERTRQGLQQALEAEVQARAREQEARSAQARLLQEEEEKLKELIRLKAEQNLSPHHRRERRQQISDREQTLQRAVEGLRESRRHRKQDLAAAKTKRRQASRCVKQWNVQLNRLMQPIVPGATQNKQRSDVLSHRGGGAFPSLDLSTKQPQQKMKVQDKSDRPKGSTQASEETSESDSDDYENIEEYLKNVSLTGSMSP